MHTQIDTSGGRYKCYLCQLGEKSGNLALNTQLWVDRMPSRFTINSAREATPSFRYTLFR
jgi:hypothetical protein